MNGLKLSMPSFPKIEIEGLPSSIPDHFAARFTSRVDTAVRDLIDNQQLRELDVRVRFGKHPVTEVQASGKADRAHQGVNYVCTQPLFSKELLVLPSEVRERLDSAVRMLELQPLIFDQWGLSAIEPRPKTALNFHGPPGTGKTLAAHTIAASTGRRILAASYADIESMFHGEGPKNVVQLFRTAEEENAVLFIDEADSLLSRRITNVTQGSEQAINSMRSQLLISLDGFRGLVIFATNLVSNYDPAFDTRVEHVLFSAPDRATRLELWKRHLPARLPLQNVSVEELAERSEGFAGREIKNTVIAAAAAAARHGSGHVTQDHLLNALSSARASRQVGSNS